MENLKATPMTKPNLRVLLQLIKDKPIITTKATNAKNNKLKETAWKGIASEFSAIVGETRRPEQLRLKWENLKKAARKRAAVIRLSYLKTRGGKSFIPPDNILDRVASMLGATCTDFTVKLGAGSADVPNSSLPPVQPVLPELESQSDEDLSIGGGTYGVGGGDENTESTENKRRKLADELLKAQLEKETALAGYFRAKADMIISETEKIKTETEKIKIEIKILKKNL